ncbi:putative nuclease HARBI1 [Heptranchias perlo]|uniref:putative nuclease HARBI1 n=1 Tax=Heptranchias perlo TaxID=212740 RepID=UPI003559CD76
MPVALKVITALNSYVIGSFQSATVDISRISQIVHSCIQQVTKVLFCRVEQYIIFPTDLSSQQDRACGCAVVVGFPRVQGIIDCTHVAIGAPGHEPATFINRKGYHSINVQLVADHRNINMQGCARYPGSFHDAFIFRHSTIQSAILPWEEHDRMVDGGQGIAPADLADDTPAHPHRARVAQIQSKPGHSPYTAHGRTVQAKVQMSGPLTGRGSLQYFPDRVSRMVEVC